MTKIVKSRAMAILSLEVSDQIRINSDIVVRLLKINRRTVSVEVLVPEPVPITKERNNHQQPTRSEAGEGKGPNRV